MLVQYVERSTYEQSSFPYGMGGLAYSSDFMQHIVLLL